MYFTAAEVYLNVEEIKFLWKKVGAAGRQIGDCGF